MKKSELLNLIREEIAFVKRHLSEDAKSSDQRIRDYIHDRFEDEPKVLNMLKQKGFIGQEIRNNKKADINWLMNFAKRYDDKILQHLVKQFISEN